MRFDIGLGDRPAAPHAADQRVCVYAPRFAEVRVSTGTNEAVEVTGRRFEQSLDKSRARRAAYSRRLVQNQSAELARKRSPRPGQWPAVSPSARIPTTAGRSAITTSSRSRSDSQQQSAQLTRNRMKPALMKEKIRLDGIKSVESTVMTGLVRRRRPGRHVVAAA